MKSMNSVLTVGALVLLSAGLGACTPERSPAAENTAVELAAATPAPTPEATPQPPPPPPTARPKPVAQAQPRPAAPPVICIDCGTIVAISEVKQKGEGSGAGAVAGAVAGGVAGHQFGKGKGKDAATAAGAILGAIAGHQVEKEVRATTSYDINIAMEGGSSRLINVADPGGLSVGSKVRVDGSNIFPR